MPVLSFLIFAFVTSFTPGPNNLMAMIFADKFGLRKTVRFCAGVGTGFYTIILLSCYFNLMLKTIIPKIEGFMTSVGVGYMLFLAYKIITSRNQGGKGEVAKYNSFLAGTLLQYVNPKGILYGITVTSTFIIPFFQSGMSYLLFSLLLALVGFTSTFSWCVLGSMFQKFLSKYRTSFNIVMAMLLVYSAVSIVLE
ncbi:MAG TPA: LysE family transporter [Bacillales bacterium]|nr:LysE family transporter [Bacillales bacterium]